MTRASVSRADELGLKKKALAALYAHLDMLKAADANMYAAEGSLMREFGLSWTAARRILAAWIEDYR